MESLFVTEVWFVLTKLLFLPLSFVCLPCSWLTCLLLNNGSANRYHSMKLVSWVLLLDSTFPTHFQEEAKRKEEEKAEEERRLKAAKLAAIGLGTSSNTASKVTSSASGYPSYICAFSQLPGHRFSVLPAPLHLLPRKTRLPKNYQCLVCLQLGRPLARDLLRREYPHKHKYTVLLKASLIRVDTRKMFHRYEREILFSTTVFLLAEWFIEVIVWTNERRTGQNDLYCSWRFRKYGWKY